MNSKVGFWAMLAGLATVLSVFAAVPNQAAAFPSESSIGQRISRLREAATQQATQTTDKQNLEGDTLISQWDNVSGSGWTNTPTWVNWNNSDVSAPSWSNGWANWDNT